MIRTLIYLRRRWLFALWLWLVLNGGIWAAVGMARGVGSALSAPPAPTATAVPPTPTAAPPTPTPAPLYDAQITAELPATVPDGDSAVGHVRVTNTGQEPLEPLTLRFDYHETEDSFFTVQQVTSACTPQRDGRALYAGQQVWTFGLLAPGRSCAITLRFSAQAPEIMDPDPHGYSVPQDFTIDQPGYVLHHEEQEIAIIHGAA